VAPTVAESEADAESVSADMPRRDSDPRDEPRVPETGAATWKLPSPKVRRPRRATPKTQPRSGNPVPEVAVAAMFDGIAARYDRVNTVLTFGADERWRRIAADAARLLPGGSAVDVACGTGKLSVALAERVGPFGRVLGVDLSPAMVARACATYRDLVQMELRVGNALSLPAADGEFDAATIAFGMRNLARYEDGFREMRRVVRGGGRVVCLELTAPRPRLWARVFLPGFRIAAALAGRLVGRSSAYRYLPASLDGFPNADELSMTMRRAGLTDVTCRRLGLGSVALHTGVVPEV
jgi:demethylmenaquinone methyltransferase/2-methoxy-6-polyprenyl-1,4-benzoquinol methylase